jgi:hypothetical protein
MRMFCGRGNSMVHDLSPASSSASLPLHTLARAGCLYIAGVDNDADCASERACKWKRFAAIVRSTCSGTEKTSLRVLCTPSCTSTSPTQQFAAPHCIQITISPEPVHTPSDVELCVRWMVLVVRESHSSNAVCLGSLLGYISAVIRLTKMKSSRTHSRSSPSVSSPCDIENASSSANESSGTISSRYSLFFAFAIKRSFSAARASPGCCATH